MLRSALVPALVLAGAVGCFDARFDDGSLSCARSGLCPVGFACVEGRCVSSFDGGTAITPDAAVAIDAAPPAAVSCAAHLESGAPSGAYEVAPPGADPRVVWCDMETAGGGWTVLVNNDPRDDEPEDCIPRIASVEAMACGDPDLGEDHAVVAAGIALTEMLWLATNDKGDPVAYRYFRWSAAQTIPAEAQWSLIPDDNNSTLADLEQLPRIRCSFGGAGPAGLRRVANETPRGNTGPWLADDVLTFFDQDTIDINNGRMSLTGGNPGQDDLGGLDDFQDGSGCADDWQPSGQRGAGSRVMVR